MDKEKIIKIYINKKARIIKINKESKIYSSNDNIYDIMIIKLDEDENDINNFLEIDQNIFLNNSESSYKNENIFILHFPNSEEAKVSYGNGLEMIDNKSIKHKCNTDACSSGGPILSDITHKVIGIHKGYIQRKNYNIGTFLKFPLLEIYKDNKSNSNFNPFQIKETIKEKSQVDNSRSFPKKNVNSIFNKNKYDYINNNLVEPFYKLNIGKNREEIIENSLCGMKNISNTDYINSSFQILIRIPQFIQIIRKNNYFKGNVINYINIIFDLISNKTQLIDPSNFVNFFKEKNPKYNNNSQQDSKMFLEDLISNINSDLLLLQKKPIMNLFNSINNNSIITQKFLNYFKESSENIHYEINDLFYVYLIHEKMCGNCHFVNYFFDKSFGIKLNFPNNIKKAYLYDLIKYNFDRNIRTQIQCENCKKRAIERTTIAKFPKILIFTLSDTNIPIFPEEMIDLRNYLNRELCKDSSMYKLFAINHHIGDSLNSGHYYSSIFIRDNLYTFNDESVTVENNLSNFSNYYILFYKKILKL